jgi:hypothetical protein
MDNILRSHRRQPVAIPQQQRALVNAIRQISLRVDGLGYLAEVQYADGSTEFMRKNLPIYDHGMFNRGINRSRRIAE